MTRLRTFFGVLLAVFAALAIIPLVYALFAPFPGWAIITLVVLLILFGGGALLCLRRPRAPASGR